MAFKPCKVERCTKTGILEQKGLGLRSVMCGLCLQKSVSCVSNFHSDCIHVKNLSGQQELSFISACAWVSALCVWHFSRTSSQKLF